MAVATLIRPLGPPFPLSSSTRKLLTLDAKIIDEYGDGTVRVEGNVCCLMDCEVVARTLTDDVEPVDERDSSLSILERRLKARPGKPSRVIVKTSRLAGTVDTLRLKLHHPTNVV